MYKKAITLQGMLVSKRGVKRSSKLRPKYFCSACGFPIRKNGKCMQVKCTSNTRSICSTAIVTVLRAQVLIQLNHPDKISLTLDLPPNFPNCEEKAYCSLDAPHNQGIEWVRTNLKIEPEVIDITKIQQQLKF